MKFINLKNDFGVDREKDKTTAPDQTLTLNWLRHGMVAGYPNMPSDRRRMYAGISKRMDQAIKEKSDYFKLNPVEYAFVKTGFENAVVKSDHAEFVTTAENALLSAVDELPTTNAPKAE